MKDVTVRVEGRPIAWMRPRARGSVHFTPRRVLQYENRVAWAMRAARVRFGRAPVRVTIDLRTRTTLRGDLDNYAKAVLDGLQKGEAIVDDRQVIGLVVEKHLDECDVTVVRIEALEGLEAVA